MRAFLFPGQGAQHAGMGRELAAREPVARRTFEEADDVLGIALSKRIWEGAPEDLRPTEICQPSLLTVEVATLRVLALRGHVADALLGHSLGEYAALVAANAVSFEMALRLVARRARLMERAVPAGRGAMCAVVGPTGEAVEALCAELPDALGVLEVAARNAPNQTTVSGDRGAVEAFAARAEREGMRPRLLETSGPFHCSLLRDAGEELGRALDGVPFEDPSVPYVANCDARWVRRAHAIPGRLAEQVYRPVRFAECVERLAAAGVERFVEVGPGRTLRGLVRRILPGVRVVATDAGRDGAALDLPA